MDRFEQDVVEIMPRLRGFAIMLSGDPALADDLVQDAVLRALSARHRFAPDTNFTAWMFTILRNVYFNHARRRKLRNEAPLPEITEIQPVSANQDAYLQIKDLQVALSMLSIGQREALILVAACGFSHEEAAEICSCRIGTIKSRLSRARDEIERYMMDGPEGGRRLPDKDVSLLRGLRIEVQEALGADDRRSGYIAAERSEATGLLREL